MNIRSDQQDVVMMGLVLASMAACSALVGGLGIVNYLNGYTLKAAAALLLPVFLGYWAWHVRDNLWSEPLLVVFAIAWLGGLPMGLVVHKLGQILA